MKMKSILILLLTSLLAASGLHAAKKKTPVWTSLDAANIPGSVKIQGEYLGQIKGGGKIGAQVIALGGNNYQAVMLPGGLPGAGWDGKNKILLDGSKKDGGLLFHSTDGKLER